MLPTPASPDAALLLPRPFRVRRTRRELADVWTLDLDPADGGAAPAFRPGQFNMLYAFGVGEVPISISGDPAGPARLVHTIRAVGAVTRAICALGKGGVLGVRGPFGSSWPLEESRGKDVVIVAGGVGLAPLRPALCSIVADRGAYGRVSLLVGARSPEEILFARELERWRGRFDLEVRVTVDRGRSDWHGEVGVVTRLLSGASFDPAKSAAFVCGPEVMMRFAAAELEARGIEPSSIFVSMERNMKCAVGVCGHCQFGPSFLCKDGPKFPWSRVSSLLRIREA
ncbi:MAG: FAD/NAD(P)-binding protein [Planctomycetes bacterium]|nr:FAD/NAD(P)-binding protein [Planctomycetota bacterium]